MSEEQQIIQVLAKYVRAADYLDGTAMGNLFTEDGTVEIFYGNAKEHEQIGVLTGKEQIESAITSMMKPHPARGWSHHRTSDPIIELDGDKATIDLQFIRFDSLGDEKPEGGWRDGAAGAMGIINATEAGYYYSILQKIANKWQIVTHRIYHDLPFAIPGA